MAEQDDHQNPIWHPTASSYQTFQQTAIHFRAFRWYLLGPPVILLDKGTHDANLTSSV